MTTQKIHEKEYNVVLSSRYGCDWCIFADFGGAQYCPYKNLCMAHKREDRLSVIFVEKSRKGKRYDNNTK